MHFTPFILVVPLALAIPSPSGWRNTPQCAIDLAALSEDLGLAATVLWGDDDTPFPTDPAALTAMHDSLLGYMLPKYPDPCQRQALIVEVGEFFTDVNINALDARDLSTSTDLQLYDSSLVPRGWKISCRKCKKLVRKIVAIVAPIVCAKVAIASGTATANPVVGSIAGYLCLDAAKQFEKKGKVEIKIERLRSGGGGMPSADRDGLAMIEKPDELF